MLLFIFVFKGKILLSLDAELPHDLIKRGLGVGLLLQFKMETKKKDLEKTLTDW